MKSYPYILIMSGIIGILTSFLLVLDKIELLKNPNLELPCNINPLISCGPVINTWQASVFFGIPNPMFGIIGFSIVLTIGLLTLFNASPNQKFWKLFIIGISLATLFTHWLIFQSVFQIGALCLYCMITWAVVWPLFFFTIIKNIKEKTTPLSKFENFLITNTYQLFSSWYVAIILLILFKFRDFFFS